MRSPSTVFPAVHRVRREIILHMRHRLTWAAFLLCALGLFLGRDCSAQTQQRASSSPESSTAEVIIKNFSFKPAQLSVHPGETIEFKNEDIFAHTATADDGSFDSGLIQPGSSWKLTVAKAGTIAYHCTPHPNMKATLVAATGPSTQPAARGEAGPAPGFNPPSSPHEFHPILVNFTAALLPLAFLSDLLGLWSKRSSLHNAAAWMVLYAAIITPLTAAAGWWWKSKSAGTLPPSIIAVHEWLGTSLAVIFILLAIWRWSIQKRKLAPGVGYLIVTGIVVLALIYQGSLGGLMVFGR
jgi:plastocyanin/uncharacterized membrane protein